MLSCEFKLVTQKAYVWLISVKYDTLVISDA
jgi:hypothetical protein